MIIVDEAHNIRQNVVKKKQNYEFISRLITPNTSVLLMTATPLQNRYSEFRSLLELLDRDNPHFSDDAKFENQINKDSKLYELIDLMDSVGKAREISNSDREFIVKEIPNGENLLKEIHLGIDTKKFNELKKEIYKSIFAKYLIRNEEKA